MPRASSGWREATRCWTTCRFPEVAAASAVAAAARRRRACGTAGCASRPRGERQPDEPARPPRLDRSRQARRVSICSSKTAAAASSVEIGPTAPSSRTAGLRVENTSTPGKIYQISVEHHPRVEVAVPQREELGGLRPADGRGESRGAEAIALEIQDCRDLLFANTYMYRVSRNVFPKTYAAMVRHGDNIRFENVKVFSQTRLAFDNAVHDEDSGVDRAIAFLYQFHRRISQSRRE